MEISKSFLITSSITEKKTNEDYITTFINKKLNIQGIILGDGIGSHYKPEIGSKFCSDELKAILENCHSIDKINYENFFNEVQLKLKNSKKIDEDNREVIDKNKAFGTTLICAVEFEDRFEIAYVGNGSIWHLRGNFPTLITKYRYLPWNSLNYLNPHTVDEDGKEVLYKFFAYKTTDFQTTPSIIKINKDNFYYGDILIITSDGMDSNDHRPIAKDKEGNIWIGSDKKIELLYHSLKKFAENNNLSKKLLKQIINEYSNKIKLDKLLDDDTTFGIIYTNKALKYQKNLNKVNESNNSK